VPVQGAPALGQDGARVTIVEFSDYQCPFCRRHSTEVFPEIVKDYVKTGKVRYVFRDFPIASLHPQAHRLHEAAHCAGDQGRYWQMHDRLFEDPQRIDTKDLVARARALGVDGPRFERCLADGVHAARVRQGVADGEKARVRGTPSFFVGFTERGGAAVRPQRLVVGAQPYEAFKQAIDALLAEKP
jgi:protein-disulfide isomerase